jgi:hypothetical protein
VGPCGHLPPPAGAHQVGPGFDPDPDSAPPPPLRAYSLPRVLGPRVKAAPAPLKRATAPKPRNPSCSAPPPNLQTTRGKKGPLTMTGDLYACKSKRTLIQLLTVNNLIIQTMRLKMYMLLNLHGHLMIKQILVLLSSRPIRVGKMR